jgi:hypothetical protein
MRTGIDVRPSHGWKGRQDHPSDGRAKGEGRANVTHSRVIQPAKERLFAEVVAEITAQPVLLTEQRLGVRQG